MPKQKKCRACGEWFQPFNTLQRACPTPECAIAVAKADADKAFRRETKRRKAAIKPLTTLCSEAQKDVNAYIRARDRGKPCISCGEREITDAGHFFHAGTKYRTSRLRFDERVIHGQCGHCNRYAGGGNIEAYTEGLRQRYGQEYLDVLYDLKRMADSGQLPPLTKDEVRQIAADHRARARELRRETET